MYHKWFRYLFVKIHLRIKPKCKRASLLNLHSTVTAIFGYFCKFPLPAVSRNGQNSETSTTVHYCLWGVLKINPEFRIFWHFLAILNLLRCMNDEFKKFDTFKPNISNFKVAWLKDSLMEWVILCSKMSTFEPRFWRVGRARPQFSLPSFNRFFNALSNKVSLVLWFLKV